jgi:hydrogenase/urease accessory protein HupE
MTTAAVTALGVLAVPQAAWAHGVGGASETVAGFGWLGIEHMLLGWDHLLFVAGVALLSGSVRRAATMISLFALGHSITLFTATVAGWQVNPKAVDLVIAGSVVFVGVAALIGRPNNWTWFAAAVGGFGLIHDLGLSTRLQAVGLPEDGMIARVLAFNVGVEIGQLGAVAAIYLAGLLVARYARWDRLPQAAGIAVIVGGVAAAALVPFATEEQPAEQVAAYGDHCQTRERTEVYPAGGGHPMKDFGEPGEPSPDKAFGHVLGDGYLVVHYPRGLPDAQVAQLRQYVTDTASGRVTGAAKEQPEVLKAVNAYTTLTCTAFDLEALRTFARDWFADPRSRPVE